MNPLVVAAREPNRPAIIMAETGQETTYAELADKMSRIAGALLAKGLVPGDHIALMMANSSDYHPLCWGGWLAGLYFTPISIHLKASEVEYLITDSGSTLVVCDPEFEELMRDVQGRLPDIRHWLTTGPAPQGFEALADVEAAATPLQTTTDHPIGSDMLYSSGTTGQPKGILPLLGRKRDDPDPLSMLLAKLYGFSSDAVYLNPAPLYHGSPLKFTMAILRFGGTVVSLRKFDAEGALAAIDRYRVTHSQWVPTMLHRMFRLPDEVKARYDLTSHQAAVHAAAPCPVELKRTMLDWWGDIIHEFYAGSEAAGFTAISPTEWRARPGSVGRAVMGEIHIVDENENELPPGQVGSIYFANGPKIKYHNSPEKTAAAHTAEGWFTFNDMGHLDEDGYLYLADRKDFMIITGGVNVYPKEIENLLLMCPEVQDVAVFGLPHQEFGEEIKAVIQPVHWPDNPAELAEALTAHCLSHLSRIKTPRSFDFVERLPRMENGKLYKKAVRAEYLERMGR